MKLLALILATMPMLHSLAPRSTSSMSLGSTSVIDYASDAFASKSRAALCWQSLQPGSPLASRNWNLVYDYNSTSGFGFGMNASMDSMAPYSIMDEEGSQVLDFAPMALVIGGSANYRFGPHVMTSLGARYLLSTLTPAHSVSSFAFDGVLAGTYGGFTLAGGVRNAGLPVGGHPLPAYLLGAASWKSSFGSFTADVRFEADYYYLYGAMRGGAGARLDYSFSRLFSAGLRLGASAGESVPFGNYFGAGPVIRFGIVSLGAAYILSDGPLDRSMAFDIEIKF